MKRVALPAGMYLRAGRPDIHEALHSVIAGVCSAYLRRPRDSSDRPNGIIIGTCGPPSLVDEAARAVGHVNWVDWRDVGGVESIEEYAHSFNHLVVVCHVLNVMSLTGFFGGDAHEYFNPSQKLVAGQPLNSDNSRSLSLLG
jgi:hypothetical protein